MPATSMRSASKPSIPDMTRSPTCEARRSAPRRKSDARDARGGSPCRNSRMVQPCAPLGGPGSGYGSMTRRCVRAAPAATRPGSCRARKSPSDDEMHLSGAPSHGDAVVSPDEETALVVDAGGDALGHVVAVAAHAAAAQGV